MAFEWNKFMFGNRTFDKFMSLSYRMEYAQRLSFDDIKVDERPQNAHNRCHFGGTRMAKGILCDTLQEAIKRIFCLTEPFQTAM